MAVSVAVISQFLVGYNTSIMNAPSSMVFPGHSTLNWSLAVSAFAIGGPFGSIIGGLLANKRGRRGAMIINHYVFLVGGIIFTLALNIYWLIIARFIIGFASGVAMVVVPVYLGEIAPPTLRGTLGTCTQFAIVIGILASNLVALPLSHLTDGWRYMFALSPLLSLLQLFASVYLVESPRWLLNKDENSRQARLDIKKLRAFRNSKDVENEVQNYLFASSRHKTSRASAHSTEAFLDLLFSPDIRILLVSSIILQIAQQLSGINAVFYYSTSFFEGVISNPLLGTILVGIVNLLATIVALKVMDKTMRRTLLLTSSFGMIVSMLVIMLALNQVIPKIFALIALLSFVTSFAIGLGPIPWLIVAEFFDSKYVATAMSLACIVNWFCNFLVGISFPFFQRYLHAYCFAPYCIILIASFLFIYFYLPETYGKSVQEVYDMVTTSSFMGKCSPRANPIIGYQMVPQSAAHYTSSRRSSIDEFEENLVDMPVIEAIEMLESFEDERADEEQARHILDNQGAHI